MTDQSSDESNQDSKDKIKPEQPTQRIERTLQNAITGRGTQSQVERVMWALENAEIYKILDEGLADLRKRYLLKHGYFGENDPEINQEFLALLDKAIEVGHWEHSLLFENAGKQLKKLRERVAEELNLASANHQNQPKPNKLGEMRDGYVIAYISLYQMGGDNIHVWERSIQGISNYGIGRPIYRLEADIKNLLANKANNRLDAYVSIYIKESDIITPKRESQIVRDHFGCELLMVKDKAISKDNIIKFVNFSGTYHFEGEKLVLDQGSA